MATTSLVIDDPPIDDYFLNFRYSKDIYPDENGQVIAYHPVKSITFREYKSRNERTYIRFKDDTIAEIEDFNVTEIHIRTIKTPIRKDSIDEINRLRLEELLRMARKLKEEQIEIQFKNVSDYNSFYGILNLCLFSSITPYSSELFESIKKIAKEIDYCKMCKDYFGSEND